MKDKILIVLAGVAILFATLLTGTAPMIVKDFPVFPYITLWVALSGVYYIYTRLLITRYKDRKKEKKEENNLEEQRKYLELQINLVGPAFKKYREDLVDILVEYIRSRSFDFDIIMAKNNVASKLNVLDKYLMTIWKNSIEEFISSYEHEIEGLYSDFPIEVILFELMSNKDVGATTKEIEIDIITHFFRACCS